MSTASTTSSIKFDPALEGLRGLACLLVLCAHFLSEKLDPHFQIPIAWVNDLQVGREAVLIFFLISGYVIGLVSLKPYSQESRRVFLWKRFVRLVPLYWLALVVSVAVYPVDSWNTIIPQFFFLQNTEPYPGFRLTVLKANYNLWSLNYEVIYYLTFLLVWRWRPSSRALASLIFGLMALGLTGWIFPHQPKILTGYAVGGAFWYTGLWMVWYGRSIPQAAAGRSPWISIWLLLMITPHLGALGVFMKGIGFSWPDDPNFPFISLRELQVLPVGLLILAGATRREVPLKGWVWTVALMQPLVFIGWNLVTRNQDFLQHNQFTMGLTVIMLACLPLRQTGNWLASLCSIGLISYGIYIFARPVQWFIFQYGEAVSGTWLSYLARVILAVTLTLVIGYIAERVIQPRIRGWLELRFARR